MSRTFTLAQIAKWIDGVVRGDAATRIDGVAGIREAGPGQITWLSDDRYAADLRVSRAGAVVVPSGYGETPMPAVLVADPERAMVEVLGRFAPPVPRPEPGVHPTAILGEEVVLGREVRIGPHVVVGRGAAIGDRTVLHAGVFVGDQTVLGQDCEIWPQVVIRERCRLGDRVVVHPNTTIGSDGFGYVFAGGRHVKIPQIGTVEIESDVEIGANCSVDRGKFGATRIGAGTKIDNQVQVAHNVRIGPGCIVVAQCGIAGSARLGTGVVLGGKVGVRDHVVLHDGAQAAACACISKDVPAGSTVIGIPAVEHRQFLRDRTSLRRVPGLLEQLEALARRVDQLEAAADD